MEYDSILRPVITAPHIALTRGWINGLDLGELAARYLSALGDDDGGVDLRVAKTSLTRVLDELAKAAIRNNIDGSATLFRQAKRIRMDARGPSSADVSPRPSFAAFVSSLDHGGEFSHSELVEIYNDRHPANDPKHERMVARQSRLMARQLELLARLEPLVSAPISWDDRVAGWFSPSLAERLESAGLKTIQQLCVAIAASPTSWFALAPGVGANKASRVERFLRAHLGSIEHELSLKGVAFEVLVPINHDLERRSQLDLTELTAVARAPENSPAPPFHLPGKNELDGSAGRLRDRYNASAIEATNDYEAMQTWLKLKKSAVTVKLYEREVTRLIAWSIQVRHRPMSSLSIEDAIAYRDFLSSIPENILIKKGAKPRSVRADVFEQDRHSIPVAGFTKTSLSPSSIKKALVIVSGFFGWLVTVRYVTANPFVGVQAASGLLGVGMGSTDSEDQAGIERARERRANVLGRVLPWEATAAINRYIDRTPEDKDVPFVARVRFVFKFATMTGLRISEMAAARRDHLEYIEPDRIAGTEGGWIIHVLGKRDKPREVPIPDALIAELEIYLAHRGLLCLPCPSLAVDKGTFLIGAYPAFTSTPAQAAALDLAYHERVKANPTLQIMKPKKVADGVRPWTIHHALKELFQIALRMSATHFKDEKTTERLEVASAHWLRHTLATRAVASGTPIDVVAGILGHANIATTSIYVQAERHRKLSEMRKLWSEQSGSTSGGSGEVGAGAMTSATTQPIEAGRVGLLTRKGE